ncbi:MAG: GyrI-like domain-containing protein [Actinomycetota bacterium]
MVKLDLKRQYREFYAPSAKQCSLVDVPEMQFLMIDGVGDPNLEQSYREAIEALYAVSYTLKFTSKKEDGIDYTVMSLEGLWWVDDMTGFSLDDKSAWHWTAMIMQPDHITESHVATAVQEVRRKKGLPAIELLRLESFREGPAVQVMHLGPYSDEPPTIDRLHRHASEQGYRLRGKHHEIYLSDPRRTAPERLRTVIRQPVEET